MSFLWRWRVQVITLIAWTKWEGNGLLGTLSTSLTCRSQGTGGWLWLREWCWRTRGAGVGSVPSQEGQPHNWAVPGGIVGKGRLCLGIVYRLGLPGPGRYGYWSNASREARVMEA